MNTIELSKLQDIITSSSEIIEELLSIIETSGTSLEDLEMLDMPISSTLLSLETLENELQIALYEDDLAYE